MEGSSKFVAACEDAWKAIQSYKSEIPDVVIVVASGGRSALTKYGHFAHDTWTHGDNTIHEVLLVAEQLNRPADDVFRTLLHEAVHGLAQSRGIKDCSGKRHNRNFAKLSMEMLLQPPEKPDKKLGFSSATLTQEAYSCFKPQIERIEQELKFFRSLKLTEKATKKNVWTATCGCGYSIKVGKKMLDESGPTLNVLCTECDLNFEVIEL